jgi:hypothetical protein
MVGHEFYPDTAKRALANPAQPSLRPVGDDVIRLRPELLVEDTVAVRYGCRAHREVDGSQDRHRARGGK